MNTSLQNNTPKKQNLLRLPKVIERTGKSRTRIYEDMKMNIFPKAIKTGPRTVAWDEQEIEEWIAARKALRE